MAINLRIREERERLGFTQTDFAALGSRDKKTQIRWEKGEQFPDAAVLQAWADAGADVLYIVTGVKSVPEQLAPRASALLDNWTNADEQQKRMIEATASAATEPMKGKKTG